VRERHMGGGGSGSWEMEERGDTWVVDGQVESLSFVAAI
jgi:hypothetical protein